MSMQIVFQTENECGFSVKFSPHDSTLIAAVTGSNFGIKGTGSLWLLKMVNHNKMVLCSRKIWPDVLLDVSWNPWNPTILSAISGDGSISLWTLNKEGALYLLKSCREHRADGSSLVWPEWSNSKSVILSTSWDGTVKMWDATRLDKSTRTIQVNPTERLNDISTSKLNQNLFSVSSSSGYVTLWDLRDKVSKTPISSLSHGCDILSHDISKFDSNILITSGVNGTILVWDLRRCRFPIVILNGHSHPIKKIVVSNHCAEEFFSASYDLTVRAWNFSRSTTYLRTIEQHSEFVTGLDLDKTRRGFFVDCSWDRTIKMTSFNH